MTMILYSIGVDQPITPGTELPNLPEIPRRALVVIGGRAPIWRYGQAFHRLHGSAAGAIAVYDPRYGAIVVASHIPEYKEGQIIEMDWPSDSSSAAPAPKESENLAQTPSTAKEQNRESAEKKTVKESPDKKCRRFNAILKKWLSPIEAFSYRLIFQFAEGSEFEIPRLRGIWGKALHSLNYTLYQKVFDGINPDYNLKKTPRYIIRPSEKCVAETAFDSSHQGFLEEVEFLTWGISDRERDDLMLAWKNAGKMGIGSQRLPFRLIQILPGTDTDDGILSLGTIFKRKKSLTTEACRLNFPVPLRLIASENRVNRAIYEPRFSEIIKSALFRLATIRFQLLPHAELDADSHPKRLPEFADELFQLAETIPASDWTGEKLALLRYSGRQRSEIKLYGTAGFLDLPNGAGSLSPLLTAAEYFHIGKSTTLGLGRIKIEKLPISEDSNF